MKKIIYDSATIGKVMGYSKGWNILSNEAYVIVSVIDERIVVSIDARQQDFVKKEFPIGSQIPVGFYGGKWHIGSKPSKEDMFTVPETSVSINEVVENLDKNGTNKT